MTNQLRQASVIEPELSDVLTFFRGDLLASLNCIKIGKIVKFDGAKKTASVQVLFKQLLPDNSGVSCPVILDCPVFTLQGGGGSIQFPIEAGDQCLVLFSDSRLDEWLQSGKEAIPGDGRSHDFSDGIVLVGMNALNSNLPIYPTDKVALNYKGVSFNLSASGASFLGTGGAEIDLAAGIVTIKNMTTTLLTLMNSFITLLEAAQVQGPGASIYPFTAAFIALLEAYKLQFATLLG